MASLRSAAGEAGASDSDRLHETIYILLWCVRVFSLICETSPTPSDICTSIRHLHLHQTSAPPSDSWNLIRHLHLHQTVGISSDSWNLIRQLVSHQTSAPPSDNWCLIRQLVYKKRTHLGWAIVRVQEVCYCLLSSESLSSTPCPFSATDIAGSSLSLNVGHSQFGASSSFPASS